MKLRSLSKMAWILVFCCACHGYSRHRFSKCLCHNAAEVPISVAHHAPSAFAQYLKLNPGLRKQPRVEHTRKKRELFQQAPKRTLQIEHSHKVSVGFTIECMGNVPLVGIVMGSKSDYEVMQEAAGMLKKMDICFEISVVSAHRTPDLLFKYAETAYSRGLKFIIAGAGGAAHLPGMLASKTLLPVFGVPIAATVLNGFDSLLSIVQMPKGIPVATMAIGKSGAVNAALFATQCLALSDDTLLLRLKNWRSELTLSVLEQELPL